MDLFYVTRLFVCLVQYSELVQYILQDAHQNNSANMTTQWPPIRHREQTAGR